MRWQHLFADLSAQFEEEEAAAERMESASRVRSETGALRLADRLGGSFGQPVVLGSRGAGRISGTLVDAGVDWLLLEDERGTEHLVASAAVTTVTGLGRRTAAPADGAAPRVRLDLRRALKGLARDRSAVQLVLDDGEVLTGTIDRVGADYLELAEHGADEPRRAEAVRGVRAVVLTAVAVARAVPSALI
jgi:hypothetical protein